jgi:MSHA pilin protein MshC
MPSPSGSDDQRGYTLVELVMTIVLIGTVAAVVLPRFASRDAYDVSGFGEDVRAVLRLAQKTAIAQHTPVYVNLDATGRKLTACYDAAYPCAAPLADPVGGSALTLVPAGNINFSATVSQLSFNWLGSPGEIGATVVVSPSAGGTSLAIVVDADSGYVQ